MGVGVLAEVGSRNGAEGEGAVFFVVVCFFLHAEARRRRDFFVEVCVFFCTRRDGDVEDFFLE